MIEPLSVKCEGRTLPETSMCAHTYHTHTPYIHTTHTHHIRTIHTHHTHTQNRISVISHLETGVCAMSMALSSEVFPLQIQNPGLTVQNKF